MVYDSHSRPGRDIFIAVQSKWSYAMIDFYSFQHSTELLPSRSGRKGVSIL